MALQPTFSVIGPHFIATHPLEVIVEKYPCGNLVITDINHKVLLKVKPYDTSLHCQRLMLDANDEPVVILKEKKLSMHKQWVAYRGGSKASSEMIFSTKSEHMILFKTHVSVILANKLSSNDDCDLKIEGSWKKRKCTIRDSSKTILAQMHEPQTLKKSKSGEEKFMVTIQPNMDYAFVVALFAIVDAMEHPDKKEGSSKVVAVAAKVIVKAVLL